MTARWSLPFCARRLILFSSFTREVEQWTAAERHAETIERHYGNHVLMGVSFHRLRGNPHPRWQKTRGCCRCRTNANRNTASQIQVVLNWFEELKRRVPVR